MHVVGSNVGLAEVLRSTVVELNWVSFLAVDGKRQSQYRNPSLAAILAWLSWLQSDLLRAHCVTTERRIWRVSLQGC